LACSNIPNYALLSLDPIQIVPF
jgi:predicted helicase